LIQLEIISLSFKEHIVNKFSYSLALPERILIHKVVEVSDAPFEARLVVNRQDLNQITPLNICLKTNNVLRVLLVIRTKQDLAVVLVLYEELHWGFDQCGHCHTVGFATFFKIVEEGASVVLGSVVVARSAHETAFGFGPVGFGAVSISVDG